MVAKMILIGLFMAYLQISYQRSTPDAPTYKGAVVEFSPYVTNNNQTTLKRNSDSYVDYIQEAANKSVDIIVFPEDGLTSIFLPEKQHMDSWSTLIPSSSENYVPCDNNIIPVSETLKKLSCAAKNNKIYVLVNIAEKLPCNDAGCPANKMLYYNSNVAFDRNGKIIARYRKTNLFKELQFSTTLEPEIVVFDTDFGVKFGTFICFDILFKEPALALTRKHKITDFLYPVAWFSQMPFLTAVQTQMGWAYSEDVNLLAAGYHDPMTGNGGSGIYLGKKKLATAIIPTKKNSHMLVADIPKMPKKDMISKKAKVLNRPRQHIHDELRRKREFLQEDISFKLIEDNITNYSTELINNTFVQKTVCQNGFCCRFNIELENVDSKIRYRMIVTNDVRLYDDVVPLGVIACGVIQCANDNIESCYSVSESKTFFKTLKISAVFRNYEDILVIPSMLDPSLLPLKEFQYKVEQRESYANVSVSLDTPRNNIVTFGIYSRDFSKDQKSNSASIQIQTLMIIFLLWVLSHF